ncbi:MAG TPA: hypothetical protein ENH82_13195 [bacterium]|nr:hypothetical protein [bacterium]
MKNLQAISKIFIGLFFIAIIFVLVIWVSAVCALADQRGQHYTTESHEQGVLSMYGDGSGGGGRFRTLPNTEEDTTENYWTLTSPDGDEITVDKEEWEKYMVSNPKPIPPTALLEFEVTGGDSVRYFIKVEDVPLLVETVVDSIMYYPSPPSRTDSNGITWVDAVYLFPYKIERTRNYLNLRINGKDWRIKLEEVK